MSADNILICLKAPKRDGKGHEWFLLDLNFSGYDREIWQRQDLRDKMMITIEGARKEWLRFDSQEEANAAVEKYYEENFVEYDGENVEIDFPFPTDREIADACARWEADRPRRELAEEIELLESQEPILRFEIETKERSVQARRYEIKNSDIDDSLRELILAEIAEAEEQIVEMKNSLVENGMRQRQAKEELKSLEGGDRK